MIQLAKKTFGEDCLENPCWAGQRLEASCCPSCGLHWPAVVWIPRFCKTCGKGPFGEGVWLCLDPWDFCALAHSVHLLERPREVWAAWRALSSFSRRSRWWLRTTCRPTPYVSAETLKACVQIGLHHWAAEGEAGSRGDEGD